MIWFLKAGKEAEYMTLNLSDGEVPSVARFAPSVFSEMTVPLPDEYFFSTRGFKQARLDYLLNPIPWADRSDDIVWRGGAVGTGVCNPDPALADHPGTVQRIRLAHMTKGTDIDVRFVPVSAAVSIWEPLLRADLTGERIPEESWLGRKYAIDVDGFTNTWSNFIIRMRYGCCVLKVASQYGYRQWYYDKLVPYEHFVPVKADLSDFFDQIEWVRSNPQKAEEIGKAGQEFAANMSFESEAEHAAKAILDNWRWPLAEHLPNLQ